MQQLPQQPGRRVGEGPDEQLLFALLDLAIRAATQPVYYLQALGIPPRPRGPPRTTSHEASYRIPASI